VGGIGSILIFVPAVGPVSVLVAPPLKLKMKKPGLMNCAVVARYVLSSVQSVQLSGRGRNEWKF
jgi:hypothetical protein